MAVKIILFVLGAGIAYFVYQAYGETSNEATFSKMFSTVFAGFFVGVLGVFYFLPALGHKISQAMFSDSNQKTTPVLFNKARALTQAGDYESAVVAYRRALIKDPSNRLGWIDMAKLYAEKLEQPHLAASCLREACNEHRWEEEDRAFILFRLSECQVDECNDREGAAATLREIADRYPDTRHSANALQQLRQLGHRI